MFLVPHFAVKPICAGMNSAILFLLHYGWEMGMKKLSSTGSTFAHLYSMFWCYSALFHPALNNWWCSSFRLWRWETYISWCGTFFLSEENCTIALACGFQGSNVHRAPMTIGRNLIGEMHFRTRSCFLQIKVLEWKANLLVNSKKINVREKCNSIYDVKVATNEFLIFILNTGLIVFGFPSLLFFILIF